MPKPSVLVLRAPGTNCDQESAYAFELAGATAERVHIQQLLDDPTLLVKHQILCLPGGFSYGDDIASGRILANQLAHHLSDSLHQFRSAGKLILGICNGFQILIKSGLLLADDPKAGPAATLDWNANGRFEDRWVHLQAASNRSVFLNGIEQMYLPVAHGEGRFVPRSKEILDQLETSGQLVLRYCGNGQSANQPSGDGVLEYPINPNGSLANVAGVCDETGRVLGLMPHPERHIDLTHHPRWTRGEGRDPGDGLRMFQNAVEFFK
ncbi:MAG: phosphoribosylformylglycinamidine synthase I [Planctomycetota bacterium]|nr:phosphoribosylformylglycinamidine synthase I [Planctomycetota bacterium]